MLTKPTDTILSNTVWKNVNFICKIIETWKHKIYILKCHVFEHPKMSSRLGESI